MNEAQSAARFCWLTLCAAVTLGAGTGGAGPRQPAGVAGYAAGEAATVAPAAAGVLLRKSSDDAAVDFTTANGDPDYAAGTLLLDAVPDPHRARSLSIDTGAGGALDLNGTTLAITAGGGLSVGGTNSYTIRNGAIAGATATLAKTGTGTLTLGGVHTYGGGTTLGGGTLRVGGTPSYAAPPVLGYIVWLDACDVNGNGVMPADGSQPVAWVNKASTGAIGNFPAYASGAQAPTFFSSSAGFGRRPVLRVYGNNNTASIFYNANNFPAPCTILFVARLTGEANYRLLGAWNAGTGSNWLLGYWASRKDVAHLKDASGFVTGTTTSADTGAYLYTAVIPNGGTTAVYRNGTLLGSSGTTMNGPNGLKVGGGYGGAGTEYSSGELAELLVYNWTLLDSERRQVERYLIEKWGLGALPDGGDITVAADGVLDLNGGSQDLGALKDAGGSGGTVLNGAAGTAATLIVGADNKSGAFNGVIANGAGAVSLNKCGTGTLTLGGGRPNTCTGLTTFAQGYLALNKTTGPAIAGDFLGINAKFAGGLVVYTLADNQFATNSVVRFAGVDGSGDHVRFELLGTVQRVAGIDNSLCSGKSVIQHSEQAPAGAVSGVSTLVLKGAGNYGYNGYLRSAGGTLCLVKDGSGTQTLYGGNITFTGPTTVNAGTLTLHNTTAFASATLINRATVRLYADGNNAEVIASPLSGSGAWIVDGPGSGTLFENRVILRGNGSDATNTLGVINGGKLWVDRAVNAIGDSQLVNVGPAATFVVYHGIAETIGGLTGSGNVFGVDLAGQISALTVGGGDRSAAFGGTLQNTGSTLTLTKVGAGTQTLTGASTYSGGTTVNAGTLSVENASGSATGTGAVLVNGGTLGGGGAVAGVVTVNAGGRVAPGSGGVGNLTAGGLVLAVGSVLDIECSAAPDNDKLSVTGSGALTLNGGGINLYQAGTTAPWTTPGTYNLISYSGAIGGLGVAALDVLNPQPGLRYRFSESGGWVVVTVTAVATPGWSGAGADANWRTAANWGGAAPAAGDALTFGQPGALRLANVNDYAANTPFGGIAFANGAVYTLGGNALNLQGDVVNATAGSQTLNLGLVLDGGSRSFVAAAGDLVVGGAIGEAGGAWGLRKSGSGTLTLGGANTYSGGTTLRGGTLALASAGALGTAGAISFSGGTLRFSAANAGDYSARFSTADGQAFRLDTAGQAVTLAAALASAGGSLAKLGAGTLTLNGASTYTGTTAIEAGTLKAGNVAQLPVNGAVAIAAGAQFDFAGRGDTLTRAYSFTAAGSGPDGRGAIINSGGTIGAYSSLRSLTLIGDTTIGALGNYTVNDTGRFDIGYGGGFLSGGGHTLTVSGGSVVPLRGTTVNLAGLVIENAFVYSEDVNDSLGALVTVNPGGAVGGYNGRNNNANIVFNGGKLSTAGGTACSYGGALTANATLAISTASVIPAYGGAEIVINGMISGPGGLSVSGGYWTRLAADNTYAGGTTVNPGGYLLLGNNTLAGNVVGPIVVNGTLGLNHSGTYVFANAATGPGTLSVYNTARAAGSPVSLGDLRINGNATLLVQTGDALVFAGRAWLSGLNTNQRGTLTVTGGSLTVAGAASDDRDTWFEVTQSGGLVNVGALYANQTSAGNIGGTSYTSWYTLTGGRLIAGDIWGSNATAWNRAIGLNLGGGTLAASKSFTMAANVINLTGANGHVTFDPAECTLTVNNALTGAGGFTLDGAGQLVLNGESRYLGPTAVARGMLLVNNSHTNGAAYTVTGGTLSLGRTGRVRAPSVAVSGAGTVDGAGTLLAPVTVGAGGRLTGTLTVGDTVAVGAGGALEGGQDGAGTLTVSNAVTLAGGAVLQWGVRDFAQAAGTGSGLLVVTNTLDFANLPVTLRVVSYAGSARGRAEHFDLSRPVTSVVARATAISGFAAGNVTVDTSTAFANGSRGTWAARVEGTEVQLVYLPDQIQPPTEDDPLARWPRAVPVTFSGYDRSETLTNFPALLVLGPHFINGASVYDLLSDPAHGRDLRFATNTTDSAWLSYEIEQWDPAGDSYVWVRVPRLRAGTTIYLLAGNTNAVYAAPAHATDGSTWTNGFQGVWHMQAANAVDAGPNRLHGSAQGTGATVAAGRIGLADRFDQDSDYVSILNTNSGVFAQAGAYTVSAWVRTASLGSAVGWQAIVGNYSGGAQGFILALRDGGNPNELSIWTDNVWRFSGRVVPTNQWVHVAYTRDGGTGTFYVNGLGVAAVAAGAISANTGVLQLGAGGTSWATQRFNGRLDEIRFSSAARSAAWLWAAYLNQSSPAAFYHVAGGTDRTLYRDEDPLAGGQQEGDGAWDPAAGRNWLNAGGTNVLWQQGARAILGGGGPDSGSAFGIAQSGDAYVSGLTFTNGAALTLTPAAGAIYGALTNTPLYVARDTTINAALGGLGFVKRGPGTLTLGSANGHLGDTRLEAGTLRLTHGQALAYSTLEHVAGTLDFGTLPAATLGGLKGSRTLALSNGGGAALALTVGFNGSSTTYDGALTGPGSLTKNGAGTLTLGGATANAYAGRTTVTQGALALAKPANTAAIPGELVFDNNLSPDVYTLADNQFGSNIVVRFVTDAGDHGRLELIGTSQAVAGIDSSSYGAMRGVIQNREMGPANTGAGTLVLTGAGSYSFGGYLRDSNGRLSLVKTGIGTQTLTGTVIDYTGPTTVGAGRLRLVDLDDTWSAGFALASNAVLEVSNTAREFWIRSAVMLTGNGTFIKAGTSKLTTGTAGGYIRWNMTGGLIDIQAGTFVNDYCDQNVAWVNNKAPMRIAAGATVNMIGGNIITVDALTGAGVVANINNWGVGTLTVGVNGGSGVFDGILKDNGGILALTKLGGGTQTLTGTNAYSGATTVNAGTLRANNVSGSATGAGTVTVNAGGALGGSGTVGAAGSSVIVAAGGRLTPGAAAAAAGVLKVAGNLVLQENAAYDWEYGRDASDKVHVAGDVTLPARLTVAIARTASAPPAGAVLLEWEGASLGETNLAGWTVTGGMGAIYDGANRRVLLGNPGMLILLR